MMGYSESLGHSGYAQTQASNLRPLQRVTGQLQVLAIQTTQILEGMKDTTEQRGLNSLMATPSLDNALGLLQSVLKSTFSMPEVMQQLEEELTQFQFVLTSKLPLMQRSPQQVQQVLQDIGSYSESIRQVCIRDPSFEETLNKKGGYHYDVMSQGQQGAAYNNFSRQAHTPAPSPHASHANSMPRHHSMPLHQHQHQMQAQGAPYLDHAASMGPAQMNQYFSGPQGPMQQAEGLPLGAHPQTPNVSGEQHRPAIDHSSSNDPNDDDLTNPMEKFQRGDEVLTYAEFLKWAQTQDLTVSAASFVFNIFAPDGMMNVFEFCRTKNFLWLKLWDHLDTNATDYIELFSFMDDKNKQKLTKRQFQACFKTFFGYLQYMEEGQDELELDRQDGQDAMKLTSFIDLTFNQSDLDQDCFLNKSEFCIGFRAAIGLLLVAKSWLRDQSGSFKEALYLLSDDSTGFLDFRHWTSEDYQVLYTFMDTDGNSKLDMDEYLFFMMLISKLNPKVEIPGIEPRSIRRLEYMVMDKTDSNALDIEQFSNHMYHITQQPEIKHTGLYHFHVLFTLLDHEGVGFIDDDAVKHFLESTYRIVEDKFFLKKMENLFMSKLKRHKNSINREQFVKYCQKTFLADKSPCSIM